MAYNRNASKAAVAPIWTGCRKIGESGPYACIAFRSQKKSFGTRSITTQLPAIPTANPGTNARAPTVRLMTASAYRTWSAGCSTSRRWDSIYATQRWYSVSFTAQRVWGEALGCCVPVDFAAAPLGANCSRSLSNEGPNQSRPHHQICKRPLRGPLRIWRWRQAERVSSPGNSLKTGNLQGIGLHAALAITLASR